ncbi:transglycosylase domain-containing protein [Fontimonas sp. SYSU GA230001]|uniref:transglycosylase domain-containing protein n=1 Tax=Fontimonas sp. SYSU GA230001 TaxID=3142450 RepID=UPI0032B3E1CF
MTGRSRALLRACGVGLLALLLATLIAQRPLPDRLAPPDQGAAPPILDRSGELLPLRHDGDWNPARLPLERIPPLLRAAVVGAEDRRFWTHHGVDWRARAAAVWQNLRAGRSLRGASTISEQVVRLLHPRPRTLWSRWVEGFEALRLEARYSKPEILEFYLNQVPYGANRRGVAQAAQYYFGRSLDTLAPAETLALAVLLRAPSRLARGEPAQLAAGVTRLADHLVEQGVLPANAVDAVPALVLARAPADLRAVHFAAAVRARAARLGLPLREPLRSSLDAALQADAARFLEERVRDLRGEGAAQGALLVVDLDDNRVRAWVVADPRHPDTVGIDAVTAPRQPGSTLKPLLYALAFEHGWGPDTRVADAPLAERVNHGLHEYRNYSRIHYGELSVREALGNSLNIPAVKALQFVGAGSFLERLRALGVTSLDRGAAIYGDGLALGNGELTLYELVQAYSALAREGRWLPLTLFEDGREPRVERAVIAATAARAINDILSDPAARRLEFGDGGVLRYPALTAVKTGTSSDYRDAWTLAYNGQYLVGVWIGDLSGRATDGVSGARGPALLARSLLARLGEAAPVRAERPDVPALAAAEDPRLPQRPQLVQPYDGLQLARDPRIPDVLEAIEFELAWAQPAQRVRWYVDGRLAGESREPRWPWPLVRGEHVLYASVDAGDAPLTTPPVRFTVR